MWRWYVVHTKPLGEETARLNLERQGYDVYFPRLQQPARRRSRARQIVPLFPRYLFLHFEEGQQSLAPVRSTLGVTAVVRFGVRYAIVPDEIITGLQLRADPVSGLHHAIESPALVPNTPVTVIGGPFESLEGLFARSEGSDRVLILLKLLGHEARVQVPADMVVPSLRAA
jgi:transcriptional antiterminator RfaH